MKIVIDIPEDVYTRLFDNGIQDNEIATDDICKMARSVRLGTPLPKEHGRLIDEKVILGMIDKDVLNGVYDLTDMPDYIAGLPAVIPAESEEKE